MANQCITVHHRTTRYPFFHSGALFLCTFFCIFHSYILFFHVAHFLVLLYVTLASCRTFLCCTHFVCNFIRVELFHIALFSSCTFFMLYPVDVVPSSCCFMLHFFRFALFFILHYFQVSLFLCCTFFVLHFSVLDFFSFCTIFE